MTAANDMRTALCLVSTKYPSQQGGLRECPSYESDRIRYNRPLSLSSALSTWQRRLSINDSETRI